MSNENPTAINELDRKRRLQSTSEFKSLFVNSCKENMQESIDLLNSENLLFASLFLLQPEINELDIKDKLNQRNQTALRLCESVSCHKKVAPELHSNLDNEDYHSILLWMFSTGLSDDGLSDDFDQIIDILAATLIKTHHEKSVLPTVVDIIFKRNRKELYIHDLVWACFLSRDIEVLKLIAEQLRSSNSRDVELAKKLLHINQETHDRGRHYTQSHYTEYLTWLKDNIPYIYFTGESFNLTNSPSHCSVDLEAKYLCKDAAMCLANRDTHLSDREEKCLVSFKKLHDNEKALLARHSQKLYRENPSYWDQWIKYPLDRQIYTARHGGGNSYGCHC